MADRLSALDVSFLYLEGATTPMHLGSLTVFEPGDEGLNYERLVGLIEDRIALVPRYRQKIVWVPGHLAYPVWVDDPDFDVAYHVRRSGLPRPGTDAQLREFCARIQSRPLDRRRPLWEMYLIEGLAGDRVAIASKTHYAMVDGITAMDLQQVILDATPSAGPVSGQLWMPQPGPTSVELVVDAVADIVRRPSAVLDMVRLGVGDLRTAAGRTVSVLGGAFSAGRAVLTPAASSPLNAKVGERRRFSVVRTELDDYRIVHSAQGVTVHDVVLAAIAGALRNWLLLRGAPVRQTTTVRALVPISLFVEDDVAARSAQVAPMFIDLPVGEPNPIVRLTQIGYATSASADPGRSVGAQALMALSDFAPPTLHAMAARLGGGLARRLYNLVVTNVPGPQTPRYAAGARMVEIFPIVPLVAGQALAIGATSYDGGVYYGLNADRDAMPDVEVLATLIEQSLAELVAACVGATPARSPSIASVTDVRARKRASPAKRASPTKRASPSKRVPASGRTSRLSEP